MKQSKKLIVLSALAALVVVGMGPLAALAAELPNSGALPENSGLPETDLPTFIGTIIRWILGIIGVILIALFVYGGFTYATSAGSQDKIESGKKIMMYAIIGVIIIVVAFVLTDYIISALLATGE